MASNCWPLKSAWPKCHLKSFTRASFPHTCFPVPALFCNGNGDFFIVVFIASIGSALGALRSFLSSPPHTTPSKFVSQINCSEEFVCLLKGESNTSVSIGFWAGSRVTWIIWAHGEQLESMLYFDQQTTSSEPRFACTSIYNDELGFVSCPLPCFIALWRRRRSRLSELEERKEEDGSL